MSQTAHDDGESEGGEDLHHADVGLGAHGEADHAEIDQRPECEQRRGDDRRREQRIEQEGDREPEGRVHRRHQELAVGEIDDVHQPENEREPHRNQPVEQPHQQAARETLDDDLGREHGKTGAACRSHPLPLLRERVARCERSEQRAG